MTLDVRARKAPKQERSRRLVDALMRATARILVHEGWDALTTNRVAKEAGVSVGSLYQYFPNKDALVSGLVEGWADEMADQFAALGPVLADAPVGDCVRRIVEATLEVTRADAPLHRSVLLQLPRIGAMEFFERLNQRVADVLAEWISLRRAELDVEDASLTAYVIVTSLDALLDHALLLRPDLLESRRFARELERLVSGCLGLPRSKSSVRKAPSVPTRAATRRSRSR
jgi:AcrR family transcriptional regulator